MTIKEQAIQNLKDFKIAADRLGIPFFLMDGTLLGAYRQGDFISDDIDDIDLGVIDGEFNSEPLIEELVGMGFTHKKQLMVEGERYGFSVTRGENHIDVMRIMSNEKGSYNLARNRTGQGLVSYNYSHLTRWCLIPFAEGIYRIPDNTEQFLEQRYVDWKTPVKRGDYDYLDVKQVPCLKDYFDKKL